ncbi:N-acetylglucosamine-6-phosphate deacetylase [Jatrophihabitans endophyticus]|uniref:N-acetylglucosamine-6-phosphate deacetylase n=1 Tax=Jatrophihabitans endophyticus TaxID=1206085 RepID=A0A1M5SQF6_9ACTN|nr:N-acetylglucosamine-6-phosphate deacetylase [Jatrophihabitans endophyticus]SHH40761.1 N-acetylglucosamine-6-phosphate deacetylase [Jatrophihabitans endophyticus]
MSRRLGVAAALVGDRLLPGDVAVADGRVEAVGLAPAGATGIAAPGLVDVQVNGYAGVDVAAADAAELATLHRALARDGVTSFVPTLITGDPDATVAAAERLAALDETTDRGARSLGTHLEGPWLAPERLGTHPAAHRCDPDAAGVERLVAGHRVVLVTLAPELLGALDAVRRLTAHGVVVLLGHSAATADAARAGFAAGARGVTHLFNAMEPLRGREPGLAGVALTRPDVVVGLVADGHHVAPENVQLAFAAAPGRVALVTDATAAAGMPDGRYRLGDVPVTLGGGAVRNAEGALAGSAATLAGCVRNAVGAGVPVAAALHAASTTPARLLGRDDVGTLRPGTTADVVVLTDELVVRRVLLAGQEVS